MSPESNTTRDRSGSRIDHLNIAVPDLEAAVGPGKLIPTMGLAEPLQHRLGGVVVISAASCDLVCGRRGLLPTGRRRQFALHAFKHHRLHGNLCAAPSANR